MRLTHRHNHRSRWQQLDSNALLTGSVIVLANSRAARHLALRQSLRWRHISGRLSLKRGAALMSGGWRDLKRATQAAFVELVLARRAVSVRRAGATGRRLVLARAWHACWR